MKNVLITGLLILMGCTNDMSPCAGCVGANPFPVDEIESISAGYFCNNPVPREAAERLQQAELAASLAGCELQFSDGIGCDSETNLCDGAVTTCFAPFRVCMIDFKNWCDARAGRCADFCGYFPRASFC